MLKTIIHFLNSNSILASISKVVLVTTVSITSVTTSAYIIDSISTPDESDKTETFISTNVESNESIEVETNQVEEEVQTSASKSVENESGLNTFITDIVTGATRLVESTIGFISGNGISDVTTGSSTQNSTVSNIPITNEDTRTGSSQNSGSGSVGLVFNDDEDDEFEDHEDEFEEEDDEFEDEEDDEEDEEDDHDEEDEEDE